MRASDPADGVTRATGAGRHLQAIRGITTDSGLDAPPGLHDPPHERDVLLLDLVVVKLPRELLMRRIVLGDDHQARGPAIEPVHDAGTKLAADAPEILRMVQQSVDE